MAKKEIISDTPKKKPSFLKTALTAAIEKTGRGYRDVKPVKKKGYQLDVRGRVRTSRPNIRRNLGTYHVDKALRLVRRKGVNWVCVEARRQGYSDYEIVSWLMRRQSVGDTAIDAKPLMSRESLTPETLLSSIEGLEPEEKQNKFVTPYQLLKNDQINEFDRLAKNWLYGEQRV